MSIEVITPKTAADTKRFTVVKAPARLTATGLAGAETISVSAVDADIVTPVSDGSGAALELTANDPSIGLLFPGTYELDKGVTAGPAGAYVVTSA